MNSIEVELELESGIRLSGTLKAIIGPFGDDPRFLGRTVQYSLDGLKVELFIENHSKPIQLTDRLKTQLPEAYRQYKKELFEYAVDNFSTHLNNELFDRGLL